MRRLVPILATVSLLSAGVRMRAADDLILARFGDYLESLRTQSGIPGLVAVLNSSTETTWERAFGAQNVDRAVAARLDTPFHVDGIGQTLAAVLTLRCVEEGRLGLDDAIGKYAANAPEPAATIRQLLTHTTTGPDGPVFSYRPDRLDPLDAAIAACSGEPFRATMARALEKVIMFDSVPGVDVIRLSSPGPAFPPSTLDRYGRVLDQLATPYSVDLQRKATASQYTATTLTVSGGLVTTARDLAKFDFALKRGVLLRDDTLAAAWTPPIDRKGQRLPHGLGWFVQSYAGEPVVWQFGVEDNATSSMVVMLPRRGLTLVLLANADKLARPFALGAGDITVSPFARVFLGIFVR